MEQRTPQRDVPTDNVWDAVERVPTIKNDILPAVVPAGRPYPQSGVALIITLILLAVVTVMAVAFLASSRRERGAVTTTTDTASARLAADAALASAEAQIVANVLATTNPYNFGLVVSTNYINSFGFDTTAQPPAPASNPTNVNYDYLHGGGALNQSEQLQNIANLLYSPRAPVFIQTNSPNATNYDFRFYFDLNRNGIFDTNGLLPLISPDPNNPYYDNNGNTMPNIINGNTKSNLDIGDPEWIGVLDHPDQPHGPNNRFIARYAFIAVPIGSALDLNAIYNQAAPNGMLVNSTNSTAQDGFMRNQGVGSWEVNLAAFLADLNTNEWDNPFTQPYNYYEPGAHNAGYAFEDALSLLSYRYGYNYNSLFSLQTLYGAIGYSTYANGVVDTYTFGNVMTNTYLPFLKVAPNATSWAGSDNTNHFFDMQELFNTNETEAGITPPGFTDRLLSAGTNISTYNRYTFYRLLSQMGTDSAPEQNKMNLNYDNLDPGANGVLNVNGTASVTNLVPWTPLGFFTNAADRMLRAYSQDWLARDPANYVATYGVDSTTNIGTALFPTNIPVSFGITNIPVWIGASNRLVYSSAIQRVLQLAANIYDASTNNTAVLGNNYPSVFRPTFNVVRDQNGFTNVYINGYTNVASVTGTIDAKLTLPVDVTSLPLGASVINYQNGVNVYGVPWIIGAKKGFPNFNEFSMENVVWIERKLEITRPYTNALLSLYQTNQMYIMSISNSIGVECWNSYSTNYLPLKNLNITVRDSLSMTLSNLDAGTTPPLNGNPNPTSFLTNNAVNITRPLFWPGTSQPWSTNNYNPNPYSFDIPLSAIALFLTNGVYVYKDQQFESTTNYPDIGISQLPHFGLQTTNRLQVMMLDTDNNGIKHVIDYVQFAGPNSSRDLNAEIVDHDPTHPSAGFWNTNLSSGIVQGVINQILYSENPTVHKQLGDVTVTNDDLTWVNPPGSTVGQEIAAFNAFLSPNFVGTGEDPQTFQIVEATNLLLTVQVPFTPARYSYEYTTWQANDPLVHYLASDLSYSGNEPSGLETGIHQWNSSTTNLPASNLGLLNDRYQPWSISTQMREVAGVDTNGLNLAFKDPLIYSSDDWDFPAYKFPTVGWLGRVHRGTPWQTVYLKASDILKETIAANPFLGTNTWMVWTGNTNATTDAVNAGPVQDRLLFDLFSTAFNDNATRGQLSVNVGANDTNNPQAGLAAWSALFSGVMVLANNTNTDFLIQSNQFIFPRFALSTTASPIQPAGAAGTASVLGQIVTNINFFRANFVNDDGLAGSFEHIGDILAVPQLTEQSANLNRTDPIQAAYGINDELYEWLPQQTMSLLRLGGSPQTPVRYVIYCYGQTLKPAPNGIVTSGSSFGMCTNYQIVSEVATRAIVRVNSTRISNIFQPSNTNAPIYTNAWINVPSVTNNNAVIENFNVLPPD
jgi:hypothetical protein